MLDTTLRDGAQAANVSFLPKDKIRVAVALDSLGISYIEGGWPGSNPKDKAFFEEIKLHKLRNSRLCAFGSTKHKNTAVEDDPSLKSILESGAGTAVLFGKSWLLHVNEVLGITPHENLNLIRDSIEYLKSGGLEVIFDAEHFYKGYEDNADYALSVLDAAMEAGARTLVLCDTTGGTLPQRIYSVTKAVVESFGDTVGSHMHNDIGCAVANTLMAVEAGARHVQGTVNGIGERTGNADLVQVIPSLELLMHRETIGTEKLKLLREVSALVYDLVNMQHDPYQPYVGANAFAHKGGIHADAVRKNPAAYEHINPELVGNTRSVIVSELSGAGNMLMLAEEHGIRIDKGDPRLKKALQKVKEMEQEGYSFDLAPASAMLVLLGELGLYKEFINLDYWKVLSENEVTMAVVSGGGATEVSEGEGPVNAIDNALRKEFVRKYPELEEVQLTDYRVVLPGSVKNTASVVRVVVEFSSNGKRWRSTGVSKNIIKASVKGLLDGLNYYLWMKRREKG